MIAGLSRCAWLISKIRRRRIIVENCEVFILVNDVSLARLTATRLHGPEASIACRWGGSCLLGKDVDGNLGFSSSSSSL